MLPQTGLNPSWCVNYAFHFGRSRKTICAPNREECGARASTQKRELPAKGKPKKTSAIASGQTNLPKARGSRRLAGKKKWARHPAGPPRFRLEGGNVRSLQALRTADHFELNRLAVVQRLIPIGLNRREVDENVLAGLTLDESKALAGIEPLYCSLFSQLFLLTLN